MERLPVSAKPLRQAMPETAALIDNLRAAFGAEMIDSAIRAGLDGQPTFWARENGQEVGTPQPPDEMPAVEPECLRCVHHSRPGLSAGYCAARTDLPKAYGQDHPLHRLPADKGRSCHAFSQEN